MHAPTPLTTKELNTFRSLGCMFYSYYLAMQLFRIIAMSPFHFLL